MNRTFFALAILAATAAVADDWPTWRGPGGHGVSHEVDLPVTWDRTTYVRWCVPLPGPGNSTPVICGDRVFITQASEFSLWPPKVPEDYAGGASPGGHAVAEKRSVMCFRRSDGQLLWQRDTIYKEPEVTHRDNPFCSASPVTDGQRVVAFHGSAGLVCYDLDGNLLWRYDVGKLEHLWGNASSPILHGEMCIQWCGPGQRQFLLAVDKHTGEKVWETVEPDGDSGITSRTFRGSWATPIVARVNDRDQLIFPVPFELAGYDLRSGKELWSATGPGTYCYSSPLVVDDVVVYGQNLYRLGGSGEAATERLKHRVGSMYISTAVVAGDYLYTINNVGVPACYEWKTGRELWKEQIQQRPGGREAWGSLVYAAGRIYIADRRGTTVVFAAGPEYRHLATNALEEHTDASIAISGGDLFIRTHKNLWCIGKPQ